METCPHCFNIVLPKEDNSCPSCLRNINDLTDSNPLLTTYVIGEKTILPEICCICTTPTKRKKKYSERCDPKVWHPNDLSLYENTRVGLVKKDLAPTVKIIMPLCNKCEKKYNNLLRYVDYEQREMTFIISKVFRDKVVLENNY
jgi:hypothetical protein